MTYEINALLEAIVAAVAVDGPFSQRMSRVIDECERQHPHRDWYLMRELDFQADDEAVETWLPRTFKVVSPDESFQGLWFGLNNPVRRGKVTADIYVGAAEVYSPESIEWAAECSFLPESGYLKSKVLDAIYRPAYDRDGGLENEAEFPLVLAYGAMLARAATAKLALEGALRHLRGAACGFDSGDSLTLGTFGRAGFKTEVAIAE